MDQVRAHGTTGALANVGEGLELTHRITPMRSLATSQVEPRYFELAAAGRIYSASSGALANGTANVVDMPTTANILHLYNGNTAASTLCLVILQVHAWLSTVTPAVGGSLICCVSGGAQAAAPAAGTGVVVKSTSGSARTTAAVMNTATALTTAGAWVPVATGSSGVGLLGTALVAEVGGLFVVPPGYSFAGHVLASAGTTPKFSMGCIYAEIEADLI